MFLHELRIPLRHLLKSPGFTIAAVLMLALGIGATTAIFSIVEGVLLRPLPFPHPERLVALSDILQGGNGEAGVTAPDIRAYTRDTHSFDALGGYQPVGYELSGIGEPAQVNAARMSGGVFPALGVAPLMGRFFTQQEDDRYEQVTVVSYTLWRSRLHGDAHVLGTKILLDRKPYVVIGVMPRDFEFPLVPGHLNNSELWVPMSFTEQELTTGAASWNFAMVGRLKAGITAAQAQSDAERVARETMRSYPPFMSSLRIQAVVRPLHEQTVEQARQLVRTLFLATMVVLLIACANLAGLLLVRGLRRRRQIALQMALGAPAGTLLREAVLESLLLSFTGGVFGVGLAAIALRVGVLESEPIGRRRVERRARARGDRRREVRVVACLPRSGALAADQVDGIVLQIVRTRAGALVGVGDRAAVLEAPFAGGGDGAIDPARAGRGRGDNAAVGRVEAVRYLHHHGDTGAAVVLLFEGEIFVARDQPFVRRRIQRSAVGLDVGSVENRVPALRRYIDESAVIIVDRQATQLLRRRMERIAYCGWRGRLEAQSAEPGCQQVIGNAVVMRMHDAILVRPRRFG